MVFLGRREERQKDWKGQKQQLRVLVGGRRSSINWLGLKGREKVEHVKE